MENRPLFNTFKRYTGITVVECQSIRDFSDLDASLQNKIESGKLSGHFNKETRTVRIYTGRDNSPSRQVQEERIVANVLNLSLYHLGWDGLFPNERKSIVSELLEALIQSDGYYRLESLLSYEKSNPVLLRNSWASDTRYSKELTAFFCRLFDLPNAETIERNVLLGMLGSLSYRVDKEKDSGNVEVIAAEITSIINAPKFHPFVRLGARPEALMRTGYPSRPLSIMTEKLIAIQKESGLSPEEFGAAFAKASLSPIAVLESTHFSQAGDFPYIVVLDIKNASGKWAVLQIERPEKFANDVLAKGRTFISPMRTIWLSNNQIAFHINHGKAKYLRESGNEYSKEFDIIKAINKNEPGPSAVKNSASDAQALRIDTNVIDNFKNSKYFHENHSKVDDLLYQKTLIAQKIEESNDLNRQRSEKASEVRQMSAMERLAVKITTVSSISEKERELLQSLRIETLGALRSAGPESLKKLFTKAQIEGFEKVLESYNLSFYKRPISCSPLEFSLLSEKKKHDKVIEDFTVSLQYVDRAAVISEDIPYPVGLDHRPFLGEAGVQMYAKLASRLNRWDYAPIFVSVKEMKELGLSASTNADPVHVKTGGEWVSYYNIADTDMETANPQRYAKEAKFMDEECAVGVEYPTRALLTMLGIRDEVPGVRRGPVAYDELKKRTVGMLEYYGGRFNRDIFDDVLFSISAKRGERHEQSEAYSLATDTTLYLANKLNQHGIKTVVVTEEHAQKVLENERRLNGKNHDIADFSVRDIMNLSYTWNGEEVSMRGFAEQFMSEIKQKDRTMEDAERIAKAFIEAVKTDPEKAGMKMLKAENMANAFRFKLPDGTIYTPEHPLASSPEYETQKGLWLIYENVLGRETMNEFVGLLSKNAPMSVEERKRFTELESKVNGSDLMQRSLEVPASKVNENRVRDIRNLIQYFEGNDDYTWTEKALIVKGAMSFGYSEKKESDQTKVEIKNISDNNSVAVPVIGGDAAAVVEGLRKGLNFKDALVQARISLSKESKRSVERNFTGWKVYKQSDKEEDAVFLNQDVAGTGWCTGSAVSTARSHLSGGDFHVYYEAGEPLIAIRTQDGYMAEPPRGAHEGQFCEPREEQIAFDYIRGGNGIVAGDDYIADIEDIRRIMSPDATPMDAFMFPVERRYENGEYGDTSAWGDAVERRIAELVPNDIKARQNLGFYYGDEIEDACRNGNAIAIKGLIALNGSTSMTLPEGVTQVENIKLIDSASLTIPEGLTQVGSIELSGSASLSLPEGLTQVGGIELSGSASLSLPEGVTQVGDIILRDNTSLTVPDGVTQVGKIYLSTFSSLSIPEGVTQVGDIELHGSTSLTLPEGLTQVGNIELNGSTSLTLPEGLTQVGNIVLSDSTSLTLPEGVTQVGNIWLHDSASLTLPEGVTQVGDIELHDSTSLTLPEGVTQVGDIWLFNFSSLTLPKGVTKLGNIHLSNFSSLTLPEGVTQVGNIGLSESTSLALPVGVTQVGDIVLHNNASLTLPEGLAQVRRIVLNPGTSVIFPDGFVLKSSSDRVAFYSAKAMNQLLSEHQKKQEFRLADGTIYGYQQGDTIYLTPAGINPNTPIHEYAHLWAKVYEKLRPDEWESLKEELKTLPQWREIAGSESYSFIESDENRLAGEVLATIVGNKGEELMLSAARDTLEEGKRTDESVVKGAEYFRQLVTDMAVKDVFDAVGMERTGEVTLKVLKDFAEGKGVKVSKEEGKKLAAMAEFERNRVKTTEYISKSNARFNEELQKQIDGEFDSEPHTYNLGYPGPILRSTGIPNLPIQVTSTKLYEKSNSDKHKYALDEIKDLVKHINTPMAVFIYGDGTLAQNIIVDIEHDNSHFLVGMSLNAHIKGSALEINSIRNVFPKDNYKWMEWIQEGKSRYMDKEKIKVLIAQQRTSPADVNHLDLDFVANIVEKFENPKVDEKYFIIDNWQYYGVFLDDRAQSIIDREFRELIPSGWRKHADHVTVLYNDYSNDMIAKGRSLAKTLGQERTMRIVALGKSDTAIALMVEGVETENKIAHITLATSPDGKPVDSNFITEWKPVEQIDISGRLGLSYKGKKFFEVLSENDVVDFQINKNNMAKQVQQQSSEKKDATVAISGLMKDADFKTLQKAALFAAWETREDNPYEFVVDMSRNELAEFLSNAEKKLNDEDRDIVSKILSHEPGYGEDYVEKQMNAKQSFRPDIETLLVDDLTVGGDVLDRTLFYLATKDMNDAQLQQLRDNVRKKAVDFYSNMDKKNALPGHKDAEKFVDKQLHSWFRPWTRLAGKLEHQLDEIHMSDSGPMSLKDIEATARDAMADPAYTNYINRELKGWIRNRCADYGLDYTKLPEDLQYEGAAETYRQTFPEYVKDTKIDILTRDAILAHIDKITALYPQYPQEPTKVSLKPDGSIVRQYGEFEYEQIKGGFERSKNLVLVEELDGETLQRKALYSMSSDSYGEHPNGPYVRFWDNGNIRSYEDCSVRVGSDNEFESDMLSFTREGIVQEKIPGDYPIEPFLEDITNEYMKTMTQREGLEPNATANKIDSALLSTWFISLTLEDKMRVFGYYHNNPENENSPIGDDIEKLEAAYKEAVEAPYDVPEVEEIVIRKGIEERLTSAFESLSDDSKGQIYRETVESGIPGLNQTQRSILNDAHTAKMSEELKTLAKECAARKSFFDGFDYDIGVLNTEKMSDSELYSFVSKNLSVLSIEQLTEAQRILEKWRNFNDMIQKNDAQKARVLSSPAYNELISKLKDNFYDGQDLEAIKKATEIALRIEEKIGSVEFFRLGNMTENIIASAIAPEYNREDAIAVMSRLQELLAPISLGPNKDLTSELATSPYSNSILSMPTSEGRDILESIIKAKADSADCPAVYQVKERIDKTASECDVVIDLTKVAGTENSPHDLDICVDIIQRSGMAKEGSRLLIKEFELPDEGLVSYETFKLDTIDLTNDRTDFKVVSNTEGKILSYHEDGHSASYDEESQMITSFYSRDEQMFSTGVLSAAFDDIRKHVPEMNIFELNGLKEMLEKVSGAMNEIRDTRNPANRTAHAYRLENMLEKFENLKSIVNRTTSIAEKELNQFVERGNRTNNTLADRLLRRTFKPTCPLPSEELMSSVAWAVMTAKNPSAEKEISGICREEWNKFADANGLVKNEITTRPVVYETGIVEEGEFKTIPQNFAQQIELTARFNGFVYNKDNDMLLLQKDGKNLISLKQDEAMAILNNISSNRIVLVDGEKYCISNDELFNLACGFGQYLKSLDAPDAEKYVVLDIKTQKLVATTPFETLLRNTLREANNKAQEKSTKENLSTKKNKTHKSGKGK